MEVIGYAKHNTSSTLHSGYLEFLGVCPFMCIEGRGCGGDCTSTLDTPQSLRVCIILMHAEASVCKGKEKDEAESDFVLHSKTKGLWRSMHAYHVSFLSPHPYFIIT